MTFAKSLKFSVPGFPSYKKWVFVVIVLDVCIARALIILALIIDVVIVTDVIIIVIIVVIIIIRVGDRQDFGCLGADVSGNGGNGGNQDL